jgi:hypothetical protein
VAEILRQNRGVVELVDAREYVPLFKCRPGLTAWPVVDDTVAVRRDNQPPAAAASSSATDSLPQENAPVESEGGAEGDVKGINALLAMGVEVYHSFEALSDQARSRLRRSAFPPTSEEVSWMHLGELQLFVASVELFVMWVFLFL